MDLFISYRKHVDDSSCGIVGDYEIITINHAIHGDIEFITYNGVKTFLYIKVKKYIVYIHMGRIHDELAYTSVTRMRYDGSVYLDRVYNRFSTYCNCNNVSKIYKLNDEYECTDIYSMMENTDIDSLIENTKYCAIRGTMLSECGYNIVKYKERITLSELLNTTRTKSARNRINI